MSATDHSTLPLRALAGVRALQAACEQWTLNFSPLMGVPPKTCAKSTCEGQALTTRGHPASLHAPGTWNRAGQQGITVPEQSSWVWLGPDKMPGMQTGGHRTRGAAKTAVVAGPVRGREREGLARVIECLGPGARAHQGPHPLRTRMLPLVS